MATSAGTSMSLSGGPVDIRDSSKGSYAIQDAGAHQENQAPRTQVTPPNKLRQRSASNLRAPLSAVSSAQKSSTTENGRSSSLHVDEAGQAGSKKRSNTTGNGDGLYTHNNSTGNLSASEQYDDIPENMYKPGKEDREGWIHREKLAKIENEELQAAGVNLAKARSRNRESSHGRSRDNSRDRLKDFGAREEKRIKMETPVPEDQNEAADQAGWDLRTPEEIANDHANQLYTTPLLRKAGSKIPVMTTSPTPIPSDRYERDTPMPRKRTISGSLSPEDTLSIAKARNVHSDVDAATPDSKSSSPTKARSKSMASSKPIVVEAKTASAQRKTSAPVKQTPASPTAVRPSTRGNDIERPKTATNRPEGDPPWLATMYKPDPMLPPDQQLIPTLAKKKQQEMWEANGDVPSTYDRQFSPLVVQDTGSVVKQTSSETGGAQQNEVQADAEVESWPLKKIPTSKSPPPGNRPTTSSGTGGYSTMPKVQSPAPSIVGSPRIGTMGSPSIGAPHSPNPTNGQFQHTHPTKEKEVRRLQQQLSADEDDEKVQKKGCCCIVM